MDRGVCLQLRLTWDLGFSFRFIYFEHFLFVSSFLRCNETHSDLKIHVTGFIQDIFFSYRLTSNSFNLIDTKVTMRIPLFFQFHFSSCFKTFSVSVH